MNNLQKKLNKYFLLCFSIIISLLLSSLACADDNDISSPTEILLKNISDTTYSILLQINKFPSYIESLNEMAQNWLETKDKAEIIPTNQSNFASLANAYTASNAQQIGLSLNLTKNFLQKSTPGSTNNPLPTNANELSYSTLLGQLLLPVPDNTNSSDTIDYSTQNYLKNVSGANFSIPLINPNWKESDAKTQYQNFYNTLASIQSYNAFLLSSLYKQQDKESASQKLTDQANSSDWFAQVASEPLGLVLRQILMYSSAQYVQMERLLKLQQQQLTAQAMANTLLLESTSTNIGMGLYMKAYQAR